MAQAAPYAPDYQREAVSPAEVWTPYGYSQETAARMAYADQNSYGAMLARSLAELDQQPDLYWQPPMERLEERVSLTDKEALGEILKTTLAHLQENSDTIKKFGRQEHPIESAYDVAAIFQAYDRSLKRSLEKAPLTDRQASRVQFLTHSEFDWSLRDLIIRHSLQDEGEEVGFEPKDFLMILNPKLKKVDYMDSTQMLALLRRSASLDTKDRLQADLAALRRSKRLEAQAALQAFASEE